MSEKVRRLRKLRVKRVDLVCMGANQGADVVLFKAADLKAEAQARLDAAKEVGRAGHQEKAMDMQCPECDAQMAKGDKFCAQCGAEAVNQKAAKSAAGGNTMADENVEIKKLQGDLAAAMTLATEEAAKREAVEKSLKDQGTTIESLKKRLDDADAQIKKAEDAAKLAEFKKSVDSFEHLPVKADVFAPILKSCAEALDAAGYAELMRVLKAADAAGAGNFVEIGAPGVGTNPRSAAEELHEKAAELIAKSGSKMSDVDAFARASAENPKLAQRARRESYAARSADDN